MSRWIYTDEEKNLTTMAFDAGDDLFVIGNEYPDFLSDFAEIQDTDDGNTLITFHMSVVAVLWKLADNRLTCVRLCFVRQERRANGLKARGVKLYPRMHAACRNGHVREFHALGRHGDVVLTYSDEMAVYAHSREAKPYVFIVRRKQGDRLLERLPRRERSSSAAA